MVFGDGNDPGGVEMFIFANELCRSRLRHNPSLRIGIELAQSGFVTMVFLTLRYEDEVGLIDLG
jgi:hypothetical protein